ncbi:fluoride efflux transporter CrcB [Pleionea sp. CnH1-48]|uniref:fluoride efflux transporter CrcB n=1 Tax=Pleionea sp. CnH1-48 TaxID=2954494 RepID=UPI00209818EF|nr:fluoride efflux transporter CrcB [Pleionea sp. CnH1-48]MCO7222754.1 fluoride efflux transporter CrcB [Pleionea sp. CnH1-48]
MSTQWIYVFAVAIGGALGAVTRFLVREYLPLLVPVSFPLATLLVNVVGCFLAGLCLMYWQQAMVSTAMKLAIMIGFFGALTTFSSFSVDTLAMIENDQWLAALANVLLNVILSLIAVFAGAWLGVKIGQ